jgi:hypothetical protein
MQYDKFYEVLQQAGGKWISVGCFLSKTKADNHKKKFNIGTEVLPIKVVKRKFLDEPDGDK